MAKARRRLTDVLVRRKLIGPDQLSEADNLASSTGIKLQDAFIRLNYLQPAEVMSAGANTTGSSSSTSPIWRSPSR